MISPIQRTRCSQLCTLATALAVLALVAVPAAAQEILVPYGTGDGNPGTDGWSYLTPLAAGALPGFQGTPGFPTPCDDLWVVEDTPFFGTGPNTSECGPPDVGEIDIDFEVETVWTLNPFVGGEAVPTDLLLCREITLCEGGTINEVALALDNDAAVWLNGHAGTATGGVGAPLTNPGDPDNNLGAWCWGQEADDPDDDGISADGLCMTEQCAVLDKVIFTFPAGAADGPGPHVLHIRARDRHELAYLDVEVSGLEGTCPPEEPCAGDDDDDDDDDDDGGGTLPTLEIGGEEDKDDED